MQPRVPLELLHGCATLGGVHLHRLGGGPEQQITNGPIQMTKQNQKATAVLPKPTKRRVPQKEITTDETVFQPRFAVLEERQIATLQDALRRSGDLDPIALWEDPDTGALTVADGHHRLEAYKRERPKANVPALLFKCDRQTALLLPMRDNAKARLSLTYEERANWAWRMTAEGVDLSANGVAGLCSISKRTVVTMRTTKAQLMAAEEEGADLPTRWQQARALAKGEELRAQWDDDERALREEQEVNRADEAFGAALSELFRRWPSAAASLVERCAGRQGRKVLLEDWGAAVISDNAEDMDLLAFQLGETFTPEQLDTLMAKARSWPF